MAMMHFGNLNVEAFVIKDLSRMPGEPEEGIDSNGEVGSEDNGNFFRCFADGCPLALVMPGCADDKGCVGSGGVFEQLGGEGVDGKINYGSRSLQEGSQFLARVMRSMNGGIRVGLHGFSYGEAHAP